MAFHGDRTVGIADRQTAANIRLRPRVITALRTPQHEQLFMKRFAAADAGPLAILDYDLERALWPYPDWPLAWPRHTHREAPTKPVDQNGGLRMVRPTTHPRPPWHVLGLPQAPTAEQVQGWRYVVLEEIVDSVALLRRWTWPLADERGHLVWPDEEQQDSTATSLTVLRDQLYIPNEIQRQPRIGDTFAVIADIPVKPWPHRTRHIAPLLKGRVFDVSAEARLAARLAYQGSVAAISAPEVFVTDQSNDPGPAPRRFAAPELRPAPHEIPGGPAL